MKVYPFLGCVEKAYLLGNPRLAGSAACGLQSPPGRETLKKGGGHIKREVPPIPPLPPMTGVATSRNRMKRALFR